MDFVLSAEYAVMAELADAHGSGPCEATHGGSNPFDRTNTLYISRVFFYDLTQFLEEKLRLIGQKELVKTAITLENSMCIAVLSCLKQDTPWTKRVGKICGNG